MQPADEIEEAPSHRSVGAARAYVDARTQGLCHDGALEVALGVEHSVTVGSERLETVEIKLAHLERALQELSDTKFQFIPDATGRRLVAAGYAESQHAVKSIKCTAEGKLTSICLAYRRTKAGTEFLQSEVAT